MKRREGSALQASKNLATRRVAFTFRSFGGQHRPSLEEIMTNKQSVKQVTTTTKIETTTLTHEEEMVVRMRKGLSEGPETKLEMRTFASTDLADMVRQMEARALRHLQAQPSVEVDASASARILDRLSQLKGQ
jgi:DNA-directed RNA polymerase sigma subunit (sigma70/sigma32)